MLTSLDIFIKDDDISPPPASSAGGNAGGVEPGDMKFIASFFFFSFASISAFICSSDLASDLLFLVLLNLPPLFSTSLSAFKSFIPFASCCNLGSFGFLI